MSQVGRQMRSVTADALRALTEDECWDELRRRYLGRVGYVHQEQAVIVPINYAVDDDRTIVMASRTGGKLDAARAGGILSLQVDWITELHQSGGSVLVRGPAEVLDGTAAKNLALRLRLRPWPGVEHAPHVLRIHPITVEGRGLR